MSTLIEAERRANESTTALHSELADAAHSIASGIDALLAIGDRGDLMALEAPDIIAVAQSLEAQRSRLSALDVLVVEAAEEQGVAQHVCARSLAVALAQVLRISPGAARARVARSHQLRPRHGISNGPLEPELPVLADALRRGAVNDDQAVVIATALRRLGTNPGVTASDAETAEHELVTHAACFGPRELARIADKIDDVLIPDGTLPDDAISQARRGITIGPLRRDGTHEIRGNITRTLRARLHAVLSPLAAPQPDNDNGSDSRSPDQRTHDALEDAMHLLLDTGALPASGGTPATVHLIVNTDRLTDALDAHRPDALPGRAAVATTALGDRLTLVDLLRLAEQADLIPTYVTDTDGIIGYGRTKRLATAAQTNALIARDHGCSFPGCDTPPEWCQRHHIIEWQHGGPTDIDNLTLICSYHHREFRQRGWDAVIHNGLPTWIPPAWIDAEHRPIRNTRIAGQPRPADTTAIRATAARNKTYTWSNPPPAKHPAPSLC